MKIQEIRAYVDGLGLARHNCRDAVREFLRSSEKDYKVMLTLTLKQRWYDKNGKLRVQHYLSAADIPNIYARFEHKLNKLIWKSRYTRHQSASLDMFKAWEDGRGTKRKHLHALVGNFPQHFRLNQLPKLVEQAAKQCYEIDMQYDTSLCDSEALDYITKEVGKRNTDNIVW